MATLPSHIENEMRTTVVGVAEFKFTTDPLIYLATYALGSCLGITFYDSKRRIGGLLHTMLPTAALHEGKKIKPAMFVDSGIEEAITVLEKAGAKRPNLEIKVFGGAQLMAADNFFRIGAKNIDQFYEVTQKMKLNVAVWEVSGRVNRTIKLNNYNGDVLVKVPAKEVFIR